MNKQKTPLDDFLSTVYRAAVDKKPDDIEAAIKNHSHDINLDEVTDKKWEQMVREENEKRKNENKGTSTGGEGHGWGLNGYFWYIVVGVALIAVVGIVLYIKLPGWIQSPAASPTLVQAAEVEQVQTEAPVLVPTEVPTEIATEAPIEVATQNSKFLLTTEQVSTIIPPLPVGGTDYFILDYPEAILNPPMTAPQVWSTTPDNLGGPFYYTNSKETTTISWEMGNDPQNGNTLFTEGGYYQVFVADTLWYSSGILPYTVTILKDGAPQDSRLIYGESTAYFNSSETGQKEPGWLSLGIYDVKPGEGLKVEQIYTGVFYRAVDRLLVVRLDDLQVQSLDRLQKLSDSSLLNVVDESSALYQTYLPPVKGKGGEWYEDKKKWVVAPSEIAWGGEFKNLQSQLSTRVIWSFPGLFPKGLYKAYALIPDKNSNASKLTYRYVLSAYQREDGKLVFDQLNNGTWVPLGEYSWEGIEKLEFQLDWNGGIDQELGVDAIAIVRMPP